MGDTASLVRSATSRDIQLFAAVCGDVNPAHVDVLYAKSSHFHKIIAHGMLGASLISTVLGTRFPSPGTILAWVIPTNEERMLATHAQALLSARHDP